jgi:hypothetical protein
MILPRKEIHILPRILGDIFVPTNFSRKLDVEYLKAFGDGKPFQQYWILLPLYIKLLASLTTRTNTSAMMVKFAEGLLSVLCYAAAVRAQECPELPGGVEVGPGYPPDPNDIPSGCSAFEILVGSSDICLPIQVIPSRSADTSSGHSPRNERAEF